MKTIYLILLLTGMQFAATTFGQTTSDSVAVKQLYVVTKIDGTEYIAEIISDDGREVLIMTEKLGKIYIPKSDIQSIIKIEDKQDIVHGEFRNEGPFTTRYSFTTNALPIKKGQNYAMVNLYGPEVHFAVSDRFNIGVMSTWIASPMALAMKYSFKSNKEKVNVSLGTMLGTSGYLRNFGGYGGLHFLTYTYGDRKNNISFSGGYGYVQTGRLYSGPSKEGTTFSDSYYSYYNYNDYHKRPLTKGAIFSVAGVASVGSKAKFIFDSMFGFFSTKDFVTTTTTITAESYDPYTYEYIPGYYKHVTKLEDKKTFAMFIMPGMRFQTAENKAFQISLAGVSLYRYKGFADGYNRPRSFPMPMLSWFFKF